MFMIFLVKIFFQIFFNFLFFTDTTNLIKKVKVNNEERHKNEPIKLYYESENTKKSPEKEKIEEEKIEMLQISTKPVKIKIVQGKSNFDKIEEKKDEEIVDEEKIEKKTKEKTVSYYESDSDHLEDRDSDYEKEAPLVGLFDEKKPSPFAEVKEIDEKSELEVEIKDE